MMSVTIKIECENEKIAEHFAQWLCGQGEHDYWTWMECREYEARENNESDDITIVTFLPDFQNFTIKTTTGKLSA